RPGEGNPLYRRRDPAGQNPARSAAGAEGGRVRRGKTKDSGGADGAADAGGRVTDLRREDPRRQGAGIRDADRQVEEPTLRVGRRVQSESRLMEEHQCSDDGANQPAQGTLGERAGSLGNVAQGKSQRIGRSPAGLSAVGSAPPKR